MPVTVPLQPEELVPIFTVPEVIFPAPSATNVPSAATLPDLFSKNEYVPVMLALEYPDCAITGGTMLVPPVLPQLVKRARVIVAARAAANFILRSLRAHVLDWHLFGGNYTPALASGREPGSKQFADDVIWLTLDWHIVQLYTLMRLKTKEIAPPNLWRKIEAFTQSYTELLSVCQVLENTAYVIVVVIEWE